MHRQLHVAACRVIFGYRDAELKSLKGRKYLDALCVYFWATTPVLISIITFATYVAMGNKLTAAKVSWTLKFNQPSWLSN